MKPKRDLTTATTALALAILFAIPAAAQEKESTETVAPPQVEEIKPGILAGYLDETEHPDSLALLPPYPKPGTAAYRRVTKGDAQEVANLFDLFDELVSTRNDKIPPLEN